MIIRTLLSATLAAALFVPGTANSATVSDIQTLRIFSEPLVTAEGAGISAAECDALAHALTTFRDRQDRDDASSLEVFLASYPDTPWKLSLLTNLGSFYYHQGYFSKAIDAWERAWAAGQSETREPLLKLADRAVGELARMHARIGHFERLETLFAELGKRPVTGGTTELLQGAREGLWLMRNQPDNAFRCGPMALGRILCEQAGKTGVDPRVIDFKSSAQGTSLLQVFNYGKTSGANLQIAKRSQGAAVLTPALIHWKVGHFAALTGKRGDVYLVQDPTFGEDLLVSRAALDAEASGYFLVPAAKLPAGWQKVSEQEAGQVWGKGNTGGSSGDATTECDKQKGGCGGCGGAPMAQYTVHALLVSLHIFDSPFGYTPAFGPPVEFKVVYNQREAGQPANFPYFNLGPKWTTNWTSFVIDDPTVTPAQVTLAERSGGSRKFSFPSPTGQDLDSLPNPDDGSILQRKTTKLYERRRPDGSREFYGLTDATNGPGRRVFLTEVIDPAGNKVTLGYDSSFRLTTITDAAGKVTRLEYTLAADSLKVTRVVEVVPAPATGRTAQFEYNSSGTLRRITDIVGITSEFTYQGDFIDSMTTPYGTTRFAFLDASNGASGQTRRLIITDPLGAQEKVEYCHSAPGIGDIAPANQVPAGISVTNNYLSARNTFYWSKKAMQTAPNDYTKAELLHWLHLGADFSKSAGVLESEKAPLENRVWYNYPDQADPLATGGANWPTRVGRVLDDGVTQLYQQEYTNRGQITRRIDPSGRESTFEYAGTGELLRVKQKTGAGFDKLAEFGGHNSQHLPATVTNAAGKTTSLTYNSRGQVTALTNPKNETWTILYEVTDPVANGFGRPTRLLGPGGATLVTFTYDAFGRIQTQKDSENYTVSYAYDAMDRITRVTFPDGTYEERTYNRLDLEWSRDRLGQWSQIFTDALQRPVAMMDPALRLTILEWCTCGALSAIVDPNGSRTSFFYDIQGRLTSRVYADNSVAQFIYENTTSRLKERIDAKGQHTLFQYFKDSALQQISYSGGVATPSVTYTYDPAYLRPITRTDGSGLTSFTYHPALQPGSGQIATIDGPLANDTLSCTYDELGRRVSRAIQGGAESRTFDPLGRLATVTNPLGTWTSTYLNATNRLNQISGGFVTSFAWFDNLGDQQLREIRNLAGPTELSKFNYTYNPAGNIASWTLANSGISNPTRLDLAYDALQQLTGSVAKNLTTGATTQISKYQYDPAGNRVSRQVDNSVTGATFTNLNQMTSRGSGGSMLLEGTLSENATVTVAGIQTPVDSNRNFRAAVNVLPGVNTIPITATDASGNSTARNAVVTIPSEMAQVDLSYDPNGNLISDGSRTFVWDSANRLISITYPGGAKSEFSYDGVNRCVRIVEKNSSSTVTSTRNFIWDNMTIAEQRDASNNPVRRYYREGYQDVPANTVYYCTRDHLGSIREVVSSAGAVVARYEYTPFGQVTRTSGTQESDFLYTGHYFDAPSGLHLAPFRAYDADLGRWLSRDPIREAGGLNLYQYCGNNPVTLVDPTGLTQVTITGGAYGVGGTLTFGYDGSRFNVGAGLGIGAGFSISIAPFAGDPNKPANADPCAEYWYSFFFGNKWRLGGDGLLDLSAELGTSLKVDSTGNGQVTIKGGASVKDAAGVIKGGAGGYGNVNFYQNVGSTKSTNDFTWSHSEGFSSGASAFLGYSFGFSW